jgi:arylsulfatase A-like enzyme
MRLRVSSGVLVLAVWFGLLTGLLEGVGLLAAQRLGWLEWETLQRGVGPEIVWIACLVDLVLFGSIGFMLLVVSRVFPRLPIMRISVFVFAFMAIADLVALTGRILIYAVVTLATGVAATCLRWVGNNEQAAVRFWRKSVGVVAAGAAVALVGIPGGYWLGERISMARLPAAAPGAPNILVIVVDTLRADHLSSYGYQRATSPNIDRLAQQGVLFENAFSESSWTPPSHATILTGRHPSEHEVEWNKGLDDRYPTIPEVLRTHGYRTAAFTGNSDWFSRRIGFGRGFMHFEDYFYSVTDMFVRTVFGRTVAEWRLVGRMGLSIKPRYQKERRRAPIINRSVLRWIHREPERPFFVFVNYYDVHEPYEPIDRYRRKFAGESQGGDRLRIDAYDGEIGYVDEHVARLVEEVEAQRRAQPLLVIITSDHGESFGDHGFYLHANSLYLNEIHVPLIVRWPGKVPGGGRVDAPVSNAAIPATLMELIGRGEQSVFPGLSLVRLWKQEAPASDRDDILAEIARQPFAPEKLPAYHGWTKSIVTPEWHYMEHEKFGSQLFNWRADRGELHDLSKRPDLQGMIKRFRLHLKRGGTNERAAAAPPN